MPSHTGFKDGQIPEAETDRPATQLEALRDYASGLQAQSESMLGEVERLVARTVGIQVPDTTAEPVKEPSSGIVPQTQRCLEGVRGILERITILLENI